MEEEQHHVIWQPTKLLRTSQSQSYKERTHAEYACVERALVSGCPPDAFGGTTQGLAPAAEVCRGTQAETEAEVRRSGAESTGVLARKAGSAIMAVWRREANGELGDALNDRLASKNNARAAGLAAPPPGPALGQARARVRPGQGRYGCHLTVNHGEGGAHHSTPRLVWTPCEAPQRRRARGLGASAACPFPMRPIGAPLGALNPKWCPQLLAHPLLTDGRSPDRRALSWPTGAPPTHAPSPGTSALS
eukprot:366343-Chlamydomonas_euryale.AAC.13